MSKLELKIYPESCLRRKTDSIKQFRDNLSEVLKTMSDIMYINNGIGLAATQVGLEGSFLVIDIGEGMMPFINPEILERSKKRIRMEEGCLSLPGVAVDVSRSEKIKVRAQNEKGESFVGEFAGLMARVIQHEVDHLNGKLIIDYMNPAKKVIAKWKLVREKSKG
ncbi:MAG: peptide deformylase [Candidatus Omnitrophota bacterium]|jgi:peptide deformylase